MKYALINKDNIVENIIICESKEILENIKQNYQVSFVDDNVYIDQIYENGTYLNLKEKINEEELIKSNLNIYNYLKEKPKEKLTSEEQEFLIYMDSTSSGGNLGASDG